jgi:hypothetical protein
MKKDLLYHLEHRKQLLRFGGRFSAAEGALVRQWLSARQAEVLLRFLCLEDDFSPMHSPAAPPLRSQDRAPDKEGAAATVSNAARTSPSQLEAKAGQEATVSDNFLSFIVS